MKATIVDLRYRMNDVLKALDRNEEVTILYRGKEKGILKASGGKRKGRVESHPFYCMREGKVAVHDELDALRGGRYHGL